ncbi:5-methylcytosine-specific restriction endonuclease system specificity protein McrC [Geobacter sp.]|uniref:5-methylcytosine-specific restriction endonuclease system specificity protein McrC n=1 Tax=Geobacter sp. TaxID=46610 RepID=UPI002637E691|nr:5-methylcytosine-specific restriction endonuclease system specificity protein McrC [Geobacter sp.]
MTSIPIRNIFYLLSYSWDLLEEAEELAVETEELPQVADLLARLLIHGTQRLLRRGMDRGYLLQTEVLSTLRGRVNFGTSIRKLLLDQGKAQCDFEEFLPDLLHNRILKTTLQALAGTEGLASRQRMDLHTLLRRMEGISHLQLRKAHFSEVRLHRNNAHYRLLMHLCELVYDNLLVNEQSGQRTFRDFLRDERQMSRLFERFVANFYRKETDWNVSPQEQIPWDTSTPCDLLPEMNADAVLRSPGRTLVVECKFYQETLQSGRWSEKPKLRSQHLYQLSAYVENLRSRLPADCELEGILVYPVVNTCLQEDLLLAGKQMKVRTLELNAPWEQVANQLIGIVGQCGISH